MHHGRKHRVRRAKVLRTEKGPPRPKPLPALDPQIASMRATLARCILRQRDGA